MKNRVKTPSVVGVLIAIVLLLTIVITRCNSVNNNKQNDTQQTPAPTAQAYTGYEFYDSATGVSIFAPSDWTKVIMHGNTTFVHQQSSAAIQIKSSERMPEDLEFDESAAIAFVHSIEGEFSGYTKINGTECLFEYIANETGYAEYRLFDKTTLISIICSAPIEYIKMFSDTFEQVLSSVKWRTNNAIPNNVMLKYNKESSYEYAVPIDWDLNMNGSTVYAQDISGESTMAITCNDEETNFAGFDRDKFLLDEGDRYKDFEFRKFSSDKSILYVEGTYYRGEEKTILIKYALSRNGKTYIISFIAPYEKYNQESQMYTDMLKLFRIIQ